MKVAAYILAGVFLIMFAAPIPLSAWLIYDRVDVWVNSAPEEATIVSCYSHTRSGQRQVTSYGPIATTESGQTIRGEFRWARKAWCEDDIGDSVTVLVRQDDPQDSRIFSFSQFFFFPVLMSGIAFILYPLILVKRLQPRNK